MGMRENFEYDVALSFAGEDRLLIDSIASCLDKKGIKVFYDDYEKANLWGKDLYEHFDAVYSKGARYCVMFLSEQYAKKLWTNHERKSAQTRAFQQNQEYILPVKLDDTEIPGIRPTVGYIDGRENSPEDICNLIMEKLGYVQREEQEPNNETDDIIIPRIKRNLSDLEKKKFINDSFSEIKKYFQRAITSLKQSDNRIEAELEEMLPSKFLTSIYIDGTLKAQCKIWTGGGFTTDNTVLFSEAVNPFAISNDNSYNDYAIVADDGYEMFFEISGMAFGNVLGTHDINLKHASAKEVAKYFWGRLIRYLQY
jgi:TIR domain